MKADAQKLASFFAGSVLAVFVLMIVGSALFALWTPDKATEPVRTASPAVEQTAAPPVRPTPPALSAQEIKAQIRAMVDALPINKSTREYYTYWNIDGSCLGDKLGLAVAARYLFVDALKHSPEVGTIFPMVTLRVVQKVEGGYLMHPWREIYPIPGWVDSVPELVFIYTSADLPENFLFTDIKHFARYAGPYQYQAVNGFTRSTLEFDMFSDEVNGWVLERLCQKPSAKPLQAAVPAVVTPAMDANPTQVLHAQAEAAACAW